MKVTVQRLRYGELAYWSVV